MITIDDNDLPITAAEKIVTGTKPYEPTPFMRARVDTMTAKEHLQSIYVISQRIKRLNDRREDIREDLYSLGGISYDKDKVQTSMSGDRMVELVARVDEIERGIVAEIESLTDQKQQIIGEIEKIPQENYKQLLFDRYVLCQKWEKIALDHDKGIRWIYRMHGKALNAFEKANSH